LIQQQQQQPSSAPEGTASKIHEFIVAVELAGFELWIYSAASGSRQTDRQTHPHVSSSLEVSDSKQEEEEEEEERREKWGRRKCKLGACRMLLGGAAVAAAGVRDKRMSRGGRRRRLAASSFSIMRNIRRCQSIAEQRRR
jgi:hypothetical protein